jgi:activating signal cointegrator complex subunit 1
MLKTFRKPKSILVHLVSLVPPIIKFILTNLQGSTESMNQWRSTTLAILRKEAPQKLKIETEAVAETVINQVNSIMDSIGDVQHTETRDQPLRALVNSAIDLSRLLRVQKAIFSIIMPSIEGHQRTMFDPDTMEDIGGEDEDTLSEREIRCVAFPGILKLGDENGERTHLRNVVAKIRVLCAPD